MSISDELESCRTKPVPCTSLLTSGILGRRRRRVLPVFGFGFGASWMDDRRTRASGALYSRWMPSGNASFEDDLNGLDGAITERFGKSLDDVVRRNVEDSDIARGLDCIGKRKSD